MSTADGVKEIGGLISAAGQTMQQAPTAPMRSAGYLLDLAGNYVQGLSDAAINAVGSQKTDAEVVGHFLSEWLVANAASDLAFCSARDLLYRLWCRRHSLSVPRLLSLLVWD